MRAQTRMPLNANEVLDEYFIENRTRLLEIAAFLDRLDRVDPAHLVRDFRAAAFSAALNTLAGASSDRVAEIQMLLSDPTGEPLAALNRKSAVGAYDPWCQGARGVGP